MKQAVTLIILLTLCLTLNAQIKTYPVSPYMVEYGVNIDTNLYHSTYTGLKTVGKGDLVYLTSAKVAASYAWTIKTAPSGSTAALDFTNTKLVTFRPDMVGDYVVELTVDGVAHTTTIVSAMYVGNNAATCNTCHSVSVDELESTGHTTIFTRAIDGTLSDHYGSSCVSCHTVGYNEDAEAVNGGFDDVAATQNWVLPATLQPGNWAALSPELKAKSNIQCENCHGPASQHTATFNPAKVDVNITTGMCAKCHDDNHYHRRPKMWASSRHAVAELNTGAGRAACQPCHSGTGFIAAFDETPGIEYDMNNPGNISCAVCHDPHDSHDNHDPMVTGAQPGMKNHLRTIADVELNDGTIVTVGGTGKLCMNCHKSRRNAVDYVENTNPSSHFGPHYNNQTDMVLGTNAITFGRYIPSSTHRDAIEDFCVSCHMAPTANSSSPAYDKVGDHSFNMSYDAGTPDPSDDIDNVDYCQTCHGPSITSFDSFVARKDYDEDGIIETAKEELHGLLEEVAMLLPPYGSHDVVIDNSYSKLELKGVYNYRFVEEDQSMGMHNYQYAVGLLKVTLEALNYGVLTNGEIMSITDVPNDNGKQVFVRWTRFGGDGVSDNPVHSYVVYREDGMEEGKVAPTYYSFDEVPGDASNIKVGSTVLSEGTFWTTVAVVPADYSLEYSVVAPTIYDATPADTVETTFMVKGVTQSGLTAETAPKSGYSVDNLVPAVPTNVNGTLMVNKVKLTWDEPVDEDFNYFAIYRSTISGFDPSTMQPYATTVDNSFEDANISSSDKYYYRIAALDFSGNSSETSSELLVMVTGVEMESGIPTKFDLSQNYPNPFNPTTTIKFAVPENSNVKITIYNAVGKEVAVLVDDQFTSGYYNYSWNASNLASGVYFYEMVTNNFRQVNKMMLMK